MKTNKKVLKFLYRKKEQNEERGIALIMTLGILSMLLVLALAFASSARTERKAAAVNADAKKAELIAEGALDRVIALANFQSLGVLNNFYGTETSTDWVSNISTIAADGEKIYTYDANDNVKWTNVQLNNEIIGRFAYRVVGIPAWIDPAACVEQGPTSRTEGSFNEARYGINVDEMNLSNLAPSTGAWTSIINKFSSTQAAATAGLLPDATTLLTAGDARWADFDSMCTSIGIVGTGKEQCRKWLVMNTAKDPEAFWIDGNSDGVRDDATELYHRFNLREYTDSNSNGVLDFTDTNTNGVLDTGEASEPLWWDDPDGDAIVTNNVAIIGNNLRPAYTLANTMQGINWFRNATLEQKTFNAADDRKNQIIANLFDYCDTDNKPTSDVDSAIWDASAGGTTPKYTGNEKTQYINEVYLKFSTSQELTPGTGSNRITKYSVKATLYVETADIYGGSADVDVFISCELKFSYKEADGSIIPITVTKTNEQITDTLDTTGGNFNLRIEDIYSTSITGAAEALTPASPEITSVSFKITHVKIATGGQFVDFAIPMDPTSVPTLASLGAGGGLGTPITRYGAFDFEVEDQRQNLNKGDWTAKTGSGAVAPTIDTNGNNNSISDPSGKSPTGDTETVTSVIGMSTAYIRNTLMQSPWELGAIHRGAAWQTLNLHKFNTSGVMGKYEDGDANIYDQVKMGKATEVYGKFNVNCGNKDCLRVLTQGIYLNNPYNDPVNVVGTAVSSTLADQFANAIYGETSRGSWNKRSEIIKTAGLSDGTVTSQDTDAKQEELIGKFINICKAGNTGSNDIGSTAYVIVLAQSIKDIGPTSGVGITINKDLDFDGTIGNANEATVNFDINGDGAVSGTVSETITGCLKGIYNQHADEITAESKIIGILELNSTTGKWELTRYEFANQ